MACVDDMSLFDRCSLLPVVSSISYWHPFVVVVVVFPGPPGANTWVCQPDTYQHPHFGCWWLSSRVWGRRIPHKPRRLHFPQEKPPRRRARREARRTVDDRLLQCRRRDGGTSCQGGGGGQRGPRLHVPAFPFFHRRDFAVPSGRTETCAHCRDRQNFPDRGRHHGVWSRGPGGRVAPSSQRST